ncbi:MAG: TolC family protein, partial [Parachlamydiales bacterium]
EKSIAQSKEKEAVSYSLPHLGVSAGYTHIEKTPMGLKLIGLGKQDNYAVDLKVAQPLYRGGEIYAGITAAYLSSQAANEQIRGQVQKTIYDTVKAYFDLLLAQELYKVQQKALVTARNHLREVERKLKEGLSFKYDQLRAEVDVTNFEAELIKQKNHISLAEVLLLKTMGVSLKSRVALKDQLQYESAAMAYDEALKIALLNRYDVLSAVLALGIENEQVKIARSGYLPKINAFFGNQWGRRTNPQTGLLDAWGREWNYGLSLEWPIFDGLRTKAAISRAKAQVKQKEYLLENLKELVSLNVEQALFSLQDADALVQSQNLDLKRSAEALNLAELNFKEGLASELVLTDALSATVRSETLYYSAIYQHNLAKLNLDLAMGVLSPVIIQKDFLK